MDDKRLVSIMQQYRDEADDQRQARMEKNDLNFKVFHMEQDYSHKKEGQSKEFLAKQSLAVEQASSFIQQGLTDLDRWFDVELSPGVSPDDVLMTPEEAYKVLNRQISFNKPGSFISDAAKVGLLASLMTVKVHTASVNYPSYETEDVLEGDKVKKKLYRKNNVKKRLQWDLARAKDFYPDPSGRNRYKILKVEIDKYTLIKMAKQNPSEWDLDAIMGLTGRSEDLQDEQDKSTETGQDIPVNKQGQVIEVWEFWGDCVDPNTSEVYFENGVAVWAGEGVLIRKPGPNPWWTGKDPFVVSPIFRVPHSVWHKAPMDAGTLNNMMLNEIYNLIIDGAMMSLWGVRQLKPEYLEDPSQAEDGIGPNTTLLIKSSVPDGVDVLKRVDTGTVGNDALAVYGIIDRETQGSLLSNDFRAGQISGREVKATEIVAANQAITSLFSGIIKTLEADFIQELIQKSWEVCCQEMDDFDLPEMEDLLGRERARALFAMSPEERFAKGVNGYKFKVHGLSSILNRVNDYKKVQALMQMIAASPPLLQEYGRTFSLPRTLEYIMRSLDVDTEMLKEKRPELTSNQTPMQGDLSQLVGLAGIQQGQQDNLSQVPRATTPGPQPGIQVPRSEIMKQVRQNGQ